VRASDSATEAGKTTGVVPSGRCCWMTSGSVERIDSRLVVASAARTFEGSGPAARIASIKRRAASYASAPCQSGSRRYAFLNEARNLRLAGDLASRQVQGTAEAR